jgi:hypothetical protein
MEACGDALFQRRVRQQVARDLLNCELVERHIAVERLDDPVAVAPDGAAQVFLVAVGVGVAGEIQPHQRLPLAVVGRVEQFVHQSLVGVGARVFQEGVHLFGRGRQSRQVQIQPSHQRLFRGFGRRRQPLLLQAVQDEGVDGVAHPRAVFDFGDGRSLWAGRTPSGRRSRRCRASARPSLIHRLMSSICSGASAVIPFGMRGPSSSLLMRLTSRLFSASPGIITRPLMPPLNASSRLLRRSPP